MKKFSDKTSVPKESVLFVAILEVLKIKKEPDQLRPGASFAKVYIGEVVQSSVY
jgi:hypothetical protein